MKTGETQQTQSTAFRTLARPWSGWQRDMRVQPKASGDADDEGKINPLSVHSFTNCTGNGGWRGRYWKPGIQHPETWVQGPVHLLHLSELELPHL